MGPLRRTRGFMMLLLLGGVGGAFIMWRSLYNHSHDSHVTIMGRGQDTSGVTLPAHQRVSPDTPSDRMSTSNISVSARDDHVQTSNIMELQKVSVHPWVRIYDMKVQSVDNFDCVALKTKGPSCKICIYPIEHDRYVSGRIKSSGIWEDKETSVFQTTLLKYPGMNVVDLGGNIGMYTLLAANLGRKVLVVEPLLENAKHVHKSVQLNGFQNRVTFVMNGLSNNYTVMGFKKYAENVGGTAIQGDVRGADLQNQKGLQEGVTMTKTILLNDLVSIFSSETLFLKMDVEASEIKIIQGGHQFFLKNDVRYVLIEWHAIKGLNDIKSLIDFFTLYGLKPFDVSTDRPLDIGQYINWSDSILWVRSS